MEKASNEQAASLKEDMQKLSKEIREESERVVKLELALRDMMNQLKRTVNVAKIKEIEHLLDVFNPIKSEFITRQEAENLIEEKLQGSKRLIREEK